MNAERKSALRRMLSGIIISALVATSVSLPMKMVQAGEDVTEHHYDENGFCTDVGCTDIYQPAEYREDETMYGGYYAIGNAGQLYWFANYINESSDHAQTNGKLTADIVVNEGVMTAETDPAQVRAWKPIGDCDDTSSSIFAGVFDGQNHTVSGLYYTRTAEESYVYGGLFGDIEMAEGSSGAAWYITTVKNVSVINSYFNVSTDYRAYVGAVGGYGGYFWNCHSENNTINITHTRETASSIFSYNAYAGGIAGCLWSCGMRNCFSANNTLSATVVNGENPHASGPLAGYVNSQYVSKEDMIDNYYLAEAKTDDGGKTAEQCASGEVAYLLNQGANADAGIVWHQTLGEEGDAYPVLDVTHGIVHLKEDGTYTNEHTLEVISGKEATCTEDGLTDDSRCIVCGTVISEQTVIPATGHSFTNYVTNDDGTCTTPGTKTAKCDNGCGAEDTIENENQPATGHSFTNYVTNDDGTCTTPGTKTAKCDNGCGAEDTIENENQPATGIHDFSDTYISLGEGGHKRVCKVCGHSEEAGHTWDSGKVTRPATCKEKGRLTYTCTANGCSAVKSAEIPIDPENHTGNTEIRNAKAFTCKEAGYTGDTYCKDCGVKLANGRVIPKTEHTYASYLVKATTKANGSTGEKCSVCGAVRNVKTIYSAKTISLAKVSYTYDGKAKKPAVTVKDSKGNKLSSSCYTVSYSDNKNVGKATVKVTLKGNYTGTLTGSFTIAPKTTSISKLTAQSKGFTVQWKKQSTQTSGYQLQYSTSSKFTGKTTKSVAIGKNSTTSKKIGKLSAKKIYYVRIRTYKTVKVNGKSTKIYSDWSKAKTVKTKK